MPAQAGTRAPASVGNLRYALVSPSELVLSWEPAAWGAEPLTYEIDGADRGDATPAVTSDTRFVVRLPDTEQTEYAFHVVTVDADGRRSSPLPLYARFGDEMQALLPRRPIAIVAGDVTRTSIALRWELDPVGTAPSSYELRRDGDVIALTSDAAYTDTGLQADTRYVYQVVSIGDDGLRSRESGLWDARLLTQGGPFAPASVEAFAYGPTTVEVVWPRAQTRGTYAVEYDVLRDGELVATVDALSLMEEDLSPGTTYRYAVRSVASDGTRSDTQVTANVTTPTL